LPCAAGRSNARKASRKKSMSICWRPTSRSSSAMRAFARVSAERLSSHVGKGLSLRGPGLGPGLRFNPSGPCAFHALIQSCRILHEIPSSRATGRTPSPRSTRLIVFNLYPVGNRRVFPLAARGHPQNEPVTAIIVSHSRVQSNTVTVILLSPHRTSWSTFAVHGLVGSAYPFGHAKKSR